jgi:nucleoside-diphosphate-sugar epimerase
MFGGEKKYIPSKKGEVRDTLCVDLKAKELLNWNPRRNLEDYIK